MSSISDERGQELLYAGIPISKVFQDDLGIGGVLSLLWFQRRFDNYFIFWFKKNIEWYLPPFKVVETKNLYL